MAKETRTISITAGVWQIWKARAAQCNLSVSQWLEFVVSRGMSADVDAGARINPVVPAAIAPTPPIAKPVVVTAIPRANHQYPPGFTRPDGEFDCFRLPDGYVRGMWNTVDLVFPDGVTRNCAISDPRKCPPPVQYFDDDRGTKWYFKPPDEHTGTEGYVWVAKYVEELRK